MTRPTKAEIILPAIKHNLEVIKSRVGKDRKETVEIIPVVKADAYGHGSIEVSKELVRLGIKCLAVACLEEASEIKDAGTKARIMILGPVREDEIKEIIAGEFVPILSSPEDLDLIEGVVKADPGIKKKDKTLDLILNVDTGMGRMGILPEQVAEVANRLHERPFLNPVGIFSHLAVAESRKKDDQEYTGLQIEDFKIVVKAVKKKLPGIEFASIANSGGIFFHPDSIMSAVRPGITLYGVRPDQSLDEPRGLEPVMRWVTEIAQIRALTAGASVSYGRKTVLKRPSRIALLPVGYADGLNRRIPPGFNLAIRGKPAPIAGVVTMDFTMIDVTDIPEAGPGDRVLVMGKQDYGKTDTRDAQIEVRAEDHARAAGTIPYEILTSVTKRVKRVYLEE